MSVTMASRALSIDPIAGLPEFSAGMSVPAILARRVRESGGTIGQGDIVVIAQKIVSKSEGRVVVLADVLPSERALELAARLGKNPAKVELILRESRRILVAEWPEGKPEGVLICEHRCGFICANAGVDESNAGGEGLAVLLPENPDGSAERIRRGLEEEFEPGIGVIIADTFGRPWRLGLVNVAIGVSGMPAAVDLRGSRDADGRLLTGSVIALADEVAAAAGLAMGKSDSLPAVIVRGVQWTGATGCARELIRPEKEDLFR